MTLVIRKAEVRDIDELLQLFNQQGLTKEQLKAILEKMHSYPYYKLFIALHDSTIVATFSLLIMDNLAHEGAPGGVLEDMFISSSVDTVTISKRIMDFALNECDERQCYKLCVPKSGSVISDLMHPESYFAQHGRCFVFALKNNVSTNSSLSFFNKELLLKEAEEFDLAAILQLYQQPDMDDTILPAERASQIYKRIKSYPNYKIYVVLQGDNIIATFALLIVPSFAQLNKSLAVVEDVMVSPKAQGKGVGKFMMQHALNLAQNKNCYQLALSSNLKREQAHHFYLSLGFRQAGASFLTVPKLEAIEDTPAISLGPTR